MERKKATKGNELSTCSVLTEEAWIYPQDFMPITLLNSTYKILDKILTKRILREVCWKDVLHQAQVGFVPSMPTGEQIFAQETILACSRKKKKGSKRYRRNFYLSSVLMRRQPIPA
ncbi:unnamed protein product [Blepharisma stoltei]|uniref:Reverse transcriptase domain-containing protein n=1 Tax=Blepharisma stoltei TaxID=1481888 RepID=A0AAU9K3M9_9CILI|nr:unnamed protein product [Blepharisma stoltei]